LQGLNFATNGLPYKLYVVNKMFRSRCSGTFFRTGKEPIRSGNFPIIHITRQLRQWRNLCTMSHGICMWITRRLELKTLCTWADSSITFLHNKSIWNLHKNRLLFDIFLSFQTIPRSAEGKFLEYSILFFLVWKKFSASITSHIKFKF